MRLTSPDFEHNEMIPTRFSCDGENINPSLIIEEVPPETKSLALIMDDPDAPHGTWVHWIVWNIDPLVGQIPAGTTPLGSMEGITSFDRSGYGGPCPPTGPHRYFFRIYALDTSLDLTPTARVEDLTSAIENHVLEQCELVGLYSRS